MKLKTYTLKTKLIILYVFSIMLPLLLISQMILSIYQKQIVNQTIQLTDESSKQTSQNVENMLEEYSSLLSQFSFDDTLRNYLNPARSYENIEDSIDAYQYYLKPITYDFVTRNSTNSLKVYFLNETLLQGLGIYERVDESISKLDRYQLAVEHKFRTIWTREGNELYVSRMIGSLVGVPYGVVSIELQQDRLYALIGESNPRDKLIVILDEQGTVISSNDRSLQGSSWLGKSYYTQIRQEKHGMMDLNDNGKFKLLYRNLQGKDLPSWTIVTQVPLDTLLKEANQVRNTGLAMMAGTLLLSILFIIFFVNRMTNRIRNLVRVMSSVKKGTLTKAPESDIQDEVGMLTTSFNLMVDGLDNSIQENMRVQLSLKDAEIKKQEAELYALQSQINPHFLFNTLESIRMKLLVLPQNETASNMIFSLSKILRKALNWKHDIIPLREELEFVRSYLDIQKSRFRDKIEDQLEVEEALMDYPIPKLIIQPLVENSIKHGIERKKGRGHIWISVQSGHQGIEVVVKDDGLGIPPDRLAHLQETLGMRREERPERESIGIVNVHDRVVLHYGEGYGLQIESEEQLGTIIRIRLPRGGE